jgi:UDP-N-acetylglucosamine--N-acetylmuramyl-(pentapeptide) pyrophosphoryl-undecaprenol N-acetylglucosamine transferase
VAVAKALQAQADIEVVFCGTRRGVEARVIPEHGWKLELLDIRPITGTGGARALRAAFIATRATARSIGLIRALEPRAVMSVGGYASGPVTLAAAVLGVPIAVLEPNSTVGLANRMLAPFARRAYIAWDQAGVHFRARVRRCYGVPLREGFYPRPYAAHGTARVLVMGGSQGAAAINERLPDALARVMAAVPTLEILHQTGRGREESVRAAYARRQLQRVTVVPFLDDVAQAVSDADLVVARAGAVTIAEIAAIGRASVLVPYPHAAADHQAKNAEALSRGGGAVSIRQDAADVVRLAAEIERLLTEEPVRVAMANASRAHGRPNAARDVAADLLALVTSGGP